MALAATRSRSARAAVARDVAPVRVGSQPTPARPLLSPRPLSAPRSRTRVLCRSVSRCAIRVRHVASSVGADAAAAALLCVLCGRRVHRRGVHHPAGHRQSAAADAGQRAEGRRGAQVQARRRGGTCLKRFAARCCPLRASRSRRSLTRHAPQRPAGHREHGGAGRGRHCAVEGPRAGCATSWPRRATRRAQQRSAPRAPLRATGLRPAAHTSRAHLTQTQGCTGNACLAGCESASTTLSRSSSSARTTWVTSAWGRRLWLASSLVRAAAAETAAAVLQALTRLSVMLCACFAPGALAITIASPTDLVKVRMQTEGKLAPGCVRRGARLLAPPRAHAENAPHNAACRASTRPHSAHTASSRAARASRACGRAWGPTSDATQSSTLPSWRRTTR